MDQLKKALAWLKAQHFWVLTALVAIVGVGSWYTSAGALNSEFNKNQGAIKQAFSISQQIAGQPFHPNPVIENKQREEVQKRAKAVAEMWQQLYDRQRQEVLKWPEEVLTKRFVDTVEKLKFGNEIPPDLKSIYQDYIKNYFPKLPAIIKARVIEGTEMGRNSRGGVVTPVEVAPGAATDFICDWLDQQDVRASLDFPQTPSSLQIWVTQEDLWAYTTLLNVVAATNAHVQADRQDNAAVQVVELLDVGQPAAVVSRSNRITIPAGLNTSVASDPAARNRITGGRGAAEVALSPEEEKVALLSERYVDAEGAPKAVTGDLTDFHAHFGTEYKRLPVRLILRMDIRQLNFLIAQCANQPLPVEVQEVRINPMDSSPARGGRAVSGMTGRVGGTGGVEPFPLRPHMATVVIQGVIYIYNEPSPEIIKAAKGEAESLARN